MNSIKFYRTLEDADYLQKIGYNTESISFSYNTTVGNQELQSSLEDKVFEIKDKNYSWNISESGLIITLNSTLKSTSFLFGKGGLVSENSTLGIAAICNSIASNKLDAFTLKQFKKNDTTVDYNSSFELKKGNYNGNISVRIVLYLVNASNSKDGFPHQPGTILGTLDEFTIQVTSEEGLFPIYEGDYPGMPLWWVNCQWTDIENDLFVKDNVSIIINRKSKNYPMIDHSDSNQYYDPGYLCEIMSSAIQLIIEKIRISPSDWSKIMSDKRFLSGSIAQTVQYMRQTFEWDFSSPEKLAKDIRAYVYDTMGC